MKHSTLGVAFLTCTTLACGGAGKKAPTSPSQVVADGVTVAVASVTLADDCGPVAMAEPAASSSAGPAGDVPYGEAASEQEAPAGASQMKRGCTQSSLQLTIESAEGAAATQIVVRKVELIDGATGKVLGELTAREPTQWTDAGMYEPWDGAVAGGDRARAGWSLSAPSWADYGIGADAEADHLYTVRVTVGIGAASATLEDKADVLLDIESPPSPLEPGVVT